MAKGVAIKFKSYEDSIFKILKLINLGEEIKKHDKIVLKPHIQDLNSPYTSVEFVEAVLKFCISNKNPVSEIFIAEGSESSETMSNFISLGYRELAEKYSVGLIDLNNTETEEIQDYDFLKFDKIQYPKILIGNFVISLPKLSLDEETEISGSLSNMLGAFPSKHYRGFLSRNKSKIRKWPIKYSIHDILKCKMPNLAVIDASDKGTILAGKPLEMDKQASKLFGRDWKSVQHLRLIDESFREEGNKKREKAIENR